MPRPDRYADDDSQPVMVPRNDKALVAVAPERVRRLREHLIKALRDLRTATHLERFASPLRPEPSGFAARVAKTACSLCKGWCCRNGDDDAFLDDRTLARVRLAKPGVTEHAVLRMYRAAGRLPGFVYLPRQEGLHIGPDAARRCLQQLFLRRSRRLHEDWRGHSHEDHCRRRQQDADFAISVAVAFFFTALASGQPRLL
jgi:hypothetical protein